MKHNLVITIGRQFGSGGRDIGKRLADMFGISYYDKELIIEAAKMSGLSSEIFERKDEKTPGSLRFAFAREFGISAGFSSESLFQIQSDTIRKIASKESCVIVGRCADYVLRDNPRCVNVFINAPIEQRIRNVKERDASIDCKNIVELLEKMDKNRSAYYNFYTDKRWGYSNSYHLTVDSSLLGQEGTAELIKSFIESIPGMIK